MNSDIPPLFLPDLANVLDHNPLMIDESTPLWQALTLQSAQQATSILALHVNQPVGILTLSDMVRLIASNRAINRLTLGAVMRQPLISVDDEELDTVLAALQLLHRQQINHLPVLDAHDGLKGLISTASICQALEASPVLASRPVTDSMLIDVVTAPATAPLSAIVGLMERAAVDSVVLLSDSAPKRRIPIGIITSEDIVQAYLQQLPFQMTAANTLFQKELISVDRSVSLWDAHTTMVHHAIRRLVIIGLDGELAGLLTQRSLLQSFDPLEMSRMIELLQNTMNEHNTQLDAAHQLINQEVASRQRLELVLRDQTDAMAMLRERERLARELQDTLGRVLSFVDGQAAQIRTALEAGEPQQIEQALNALVGVVHSARQDVREFVVGANAQRQMAEGPGRFYAALEEHLQRLDSLYNFHTELIVEPEAASQQLPPLVEVHLLRIIQEALNNVRRHAGVMEAQLHFAFRDQQLIVQVIDQGRGFDPHRTAMNAPDNYRSGYGLQSMRSRAGEIGGVVQYYTALAQGTTVEMVVPLYPVQDFARESIRLLLVDDNDLFRQMLRKILISRGFTVVGVADSGNAAIEQVRALNPDIVLMDVEMPGMGGLDATSEILAEYPDMRIVMLTVAEDDLTLFEAVRRGAAGYLLKDLDAGQISDRIIGLMRGEAALSPGVTQRVLSELASQMQRSDDLPAETTLDPMSVLTIHQIKILTLLAQGYTYKEIGRILGYSERAIKYHTGEAIRQLDLKDRSAAIAYTRSLMQRGTWPQLLDS